MAAGVTLYDAAWSTAVARSVEVATVYGEVALVGLSGYRSFGRDLCLFGPLGRVILLAGQNNAGKSSGCRR